MNLGYAQISCLAAFRFCVIPALFPVEHFLLIFLCRGIFAFVECTTFF